MGAKTIPQGGKNEKWLGLGDEAWFIDVSFDIGQVRQNTCKEELSRTSRIMLLSS